VIVPIFAQLAEVIPQVQEVQIAEGGRNVEKWKSRSEYQQKLKKLEEERKRNSTGSRVSRNNESVSSKGQSSDDKVSKKSRE
jgi:hypothetical protein